MIKSVELFGNLFLCSGQRWTLRLLLVLFLGFSFPASSQVYQPQEENFAYEVKQIDEFFERFNNESTLIKTYLSEKYDQLQLSRADLIKSLFDLKNKQLEEEHVRQFINKVDDPLKPVTLSFYDRDWYARLKCSVLYQEEERDLFLLLKVQKDANGGSKWVVQHVYADFLKTPEAEEGGAFLNPISHATDFMGLKRAFDEPQNLKSYLPSDFRDDPLSKLVSEMQHSRIRFQQVEDISYHFFQVDGWIFSVERFQRPEKNAGWLISNLLPADAKKKEKYKEKLLKQAI